MKVKKLPSGNYNIQLYVGHDDEGKLIRKSITAPTEWEVIKMATDFKNGIEYDKEHITVKKALRSYIDSRCNVVSTTTLYTYNIIAEKRVKGIENIEINKLSRLDVQKMINAAANKGMSYRTIKDTLALLRCALSYYGVEVAPTSKFTLPQKKAKKGDLPPLEKVLPIIIGSSVELPCLLAMWCGGLRMSEVRGLQYRDITTTEDGRHLLSVNRVRNCISGHDVVQNRTKTVDSARDVPIPDYVYSLITAKPHTSDTEFIINENYGALKRRYDRLLKKNGIKMTFHELRAMFATTMNGLGVPKEVLQMLGGWSNSVILDSVYIRTPQQQLTEGMNKLNDYLSHIIENTGEVIEII